tara:strand:+ start:2037 stop:2309 length:273 start_codon:yes stop_codon:yes gene_type:complete
MTAWSVAEGAVSGGATLIARFQGAPIAMSSFKKIAADDELWKQYCERLSKNTVVNCGLMGNDVRVAINRMSTPQPQEETAYQRFNKRNRS